MTKLFPYPFVNQAALVEATGCRSISDGLMLLFGQRDPDNAGSLKHGFRYFHEILFEVSHIVMLPERRQFLDRVGRW